jgi:radical SAM superfamily enzyme YgiQ (UPF0313 family)
MSTGKHLLLINPWIYDFAAYDLWSKPLGLLYLASFLRSNGFSISYIDCLTKTNVKKYGIGNFRREVVPKPTILADIPRQYARYGISEIQFTEMLQTIPRPDAILVTSIMTYWYLGPQHVVEILRKRFPGVPVILGGIYTTLMPEHAQQTIRPDYRISGPGEIAVLDLLCGLFNLDKNSMTMPTNIDEYPYPAFDLQQNLDYLIIMTARGCPYDCSFCAQKRISMPFTQRSPDNVVKEIQYHYNKFQIRDFAFYDDALFIGRERHIKIILRNLIALKLPLRFHSPNGLFAKLIDEELADLMYRAHFKTIRLSFETSNENRRADMYNKISNSGMEMAVKNLVKAGYSKGDLEAYVIMGLPDQDLTEILASMIFINNLGLQVRPASFSPIPGTLDFSRSVKMGLIDRDVDPLLTNKSIFPLQNQNLDYNTFGRIRMLGQLMNESAQKQFALFTDTKIGPVLSKILKELH